MMHSFLSTTQIYTLALFSGLSCSLALHVFVGEVLEPGKGAGIALESLVHEAVCSPWGPGYENTFGEGKGVRLTKRGSYNFEENADNQGMEERKGLGLDVENGNIPAAGAMRVVL